LKIDCPNSLARQDFTKNPPHLFTSVDVRDAGFKIAPVDTNIFPAGWHLLSEAGAETASKYMAQYLQDKQPKCKKIGIVGENFSRNEHYWKNVQALEKIIADAGYGVVVGVTASEIAEAQPINGLRHIHKNADGLIFFGDEQPCVIVSNRDFASGAPEEFRDIKQPVFPPVSMGWYRRSKSAHFEAYDQVARKFAEKHNFDPWLISSYHEACGTVDFKRKEGLECVALNVDKTIRRIAKKYEEYGIEQEPFVFIKADSGSFGMGIMTARGGDEVLDVNKKLRNKMSSTKDNMDIGQVIIQEGVPTIQTSDGKIAESLVYMVAGEVVDSFLRVNDQKSALENLNSSGMSFAIDTDKSEFVKIIAKLAAIAACNEN